jgi:transposase
MRTLLGKKADLTLKELRAAVALECSLPAIHYALEKMGLTYKKRRCGPATKPPRHRAGTPGVAAAPTRLRSSQADLSE